MKDDSYALKHAMIYTSLVALILLAPLFFYVTYMKNLQLIQNEIFLKEKSLVVIASMEDYNANNKHFIYPRFQAFTSGLYAKNLEPIFTLIKSDILQFHKGYSLQGDRSYYMVELPKDRYFKASYLILSSELSFANTYKDAALILLSIAFLVFSLSLFFLDRFSRPFKQLNNELDNFIKDSMHEINTPLSIININIDLYSRKNESNKYLSRIKAASKVLSGIYNDMDYLIKHDRLDFPDEVVNLSTLLLERIDYFREVAVMKNLEMKHNIDSDIEVNINPKQLQLLIDNSISNAIKYSYEKGMVEVMLESGESNAILSFIDHGVGISNTERIFHRYYREDKQKSGFGIGLSIVSSIIQKYNIGVEINSKLKQGSTFRYYIPIFKI